MLLEVDTMPKTVAWMRQLAGRPRKRKIEYFGINTGGVKVLKSYKLYITVQRSTSSH